MKKSIALACFLLISLQVCAQSRAKGTVFEDLNANGSKDRGEPSVAGVAVSNGREVVLTDQNGSWTLPAGDDTGFFVIKPPGYMTAVGPNNIPAGFYLHKPSGSPELPVKGVAATGPLPASIDFPLTRQEERPKFKVLVFGDTQARGMAEVNYVTRDVVEECIGTDAVFGVSLGDVVADDPNLFKEVNESIAKIGVPWYNVFGNHDFNRGATDDRYSDETFERFYGPSTYAFEYGEVAFVVLKNIFFDASGKYKAHLTDSQLGFVKNYLSVVPDNKLVVVLMHAPVIACDNRRELFALLEKRRHTFSVSGHTHTMAHVFVDEKLGWAGEQPHHHFVNATVCGSWWCGLKDETGIPHATMNDGAPNGYSYLSFDGNEYSLVFKAARRPAGHQMNIYLPDDIAQTALDTMPVVVNVFAGSPRSVVEMQFNGTGDWLPLEYTPMRDPGVAAMGVLNPYLKTPVNGVNLDKVFGWQMDPPSLSRHIWKAGLPKKLPVGTHLLKIRTTDMFGQTWTGNRVFRVN